LIPEIWVRNNDGDWPDNVADPIMELSPNEILDSLLRRATKHLAQGTESSEDFALILPFHNHWEQLLHKYSAIVTPELLARASTLAPPLNKILENLLKKRELKELNFEGQLLTRADLAKLLGLMKSNAAHGPQFFSHPEDAPLLTKMSEFIAKIEGDDALSSDQIYCLHVIFEDYERGLFGDSETLGNILIAKLRSSKTISQLRPNATCTAELDIQRGNFREYQDTFSSRVRALPLNDEVRQEMCEVMLPGLDHLINREDEIVSHATTNFGVLYELVKDKLPLHTDHTPVSDGEAYRQTLHRLVINFFGAAQLCYSKGRLDAFCGKISRGFCLEGRIRDTFEWAISLDNIVSFDASMEKFVSHECLPYALVMHGIPAEKVYTEYAVKFIMDRHSNALCLPHDLYAPSGKITRDGVTAYIKDILCYESRPLLVEIDEEISKYRKKIEGRLIFHKHSKHLKIQALVDLRARITEEEYTSETAIDYLIGKYPQLLAGNFFEKVRAMFEGEAASSFIHSI
jgi:hypothetical protein